MSRDVPMSSPMIGAEEEAAVLRVLRSRRLAQGPEVEAFEDEFSAWVDGRICVAVSSGTAALHLLLAAHGVGPGDEVIVPSFTFAATANAVRLVGATPVFVDIDPVTFCMDPDSAEAAVTERTAAVMPVHLYGHVADMTSIAVFARRAGILVLEDAAQAHGASLHGAAAGSLGDGAAFSFYPTKNMTTGEGGMVAVRDAAVARTIRLLRNQGMEAQYEHETVGFNLRMTDLHAAIGRVQLRALAHNNAARQGNALRYSEHLTGFTVPTAAPGVVHVFHQYTLRTPDRDALRSHLADRGIEARSYYPVPVHRLKPYAEELELPATDAAAAEVLSLPVGPHLAPEDLEYVIDGALSWLDEQ